MRLRKLCLGTIMLGVGCSGAEDQSEPLGRIESALTATQATILGFESPLAHWTSSQGTLSAGTTASQGSASLGVAPNGYTIIQSVALSSLGDIGTSLSYDIRIPQALPYWGETRAILEIPSKGIYWMDLGGASLVGLTPGAFHTVTFPLSASAVQALESTYSDLVIKLVLNAPAAGSPYFIDNIDVGATSGGTTEPPGDVLELSVDIPDPFTADDMLFVASSSLLLDSGTKSGALGADEELATLGSGQLAASARIDGSLSVGGDIFLGNNSTITQSLSYVGGITQQAGANPGAASQVTSIPTHTVTFSVTLPPATGTSVDLDVGETESAAPGRYTGLSVKRDADLYLTSGVYYFDSVYVSPQGEVHLDESDGPIQIYVGSSFSFEGSMVATGGDPGDLLVGYLGASDAFVQGAFLGTMVAPNAAIRLHRPSNNAPHQGAFFGKTVELFSDAQALHVPFPWEVFDDGGLGGDPTFGPVGPEDVPDPTSTPVSTDLTCGADFNAIIDPESDTNNDGLPDIVQIIPRTPAPGCPVTEYCQRIVASDGSVDYVPVPSTPVLDPKFPIPSGAITNGCTGEDASAACPILGSTGLQAIGCEALDPDPNCLTVTVCPDPGSWDDPTNPDVKHIAEALSADDLPDMIPPGLIDVTPEDVMEVLEELSPLYINPCEWNEVLDKFSFDVDILGAGIGEGEACTQNDECKSGSCVPDFNFCTSDLSPCIPGNACPGDGTCELYAGHCGATSALCRTNSDCAVGDTCMPSIIMNHVCTKPTNPMLVNYEEGSSNWNVAFKGGVNEGRVAVRRAAFFPSTEFDIAVNTDAHLSTTAFGNKFDLFDVDITSIISECGYNFDWNSSTGDDDFQVVDGLIRENLGVGAYVPGNVADIEAATPSYEQGQCEALLASLHAQEELLNQALHEATIATLFYNLAGPNGTVITSQASAQALIDSYEAQAVLYKQALADYEAAQQAALDHLVAGKVLDFEFDLDIDFVKSFGIGPFNPAIEIGIFGRAGLSNVEMENQANTHYTNTVDTPCGGEECMKLSVKGSAAPKAAAGLFAFIGGGINLVVAGGRVGIRGELDLANFQLPLAAEFELDRTTLPASTLTQSIPNVPPALAAFIPGAAQLAQSNLFVVPPQVGQYKAPYAIGGQLENADDISLQAQFLSGRIKLWAKAWFLFWSKKYEKTLVEWNGIPREWHVGTPIVGDGTMVTGTEELRHLIGMVAAPNMVLLPKLALLPIPGMADPTTTSNSINDAIDTKVTENEGYDFDAHHEADIGRPWAPSTDGGRCYKYEPLPPQ